MQTRSKTRTGTHIVTQEKQTDNKDKKGPILVTQVQEDVNTQRVSRPLNKSDTSDTSDTSDMSNTSDIKKFMKYYNEQNTKYMHQFFEKWNNMDDIMGGFCSCDYNALLVNKALLKIDLGKYLKGTIVDQVYVERETITIYPVVDSPQLGPLAYASPNTILYIARKPKDNKDNEDEDDEDEFEDDSDEYRYGTVYIDPKLYPIEYKTVDQCLEDLHQDFGTSVPYGYWS